MGAMAALPDRILLEPAIRAARKAIADIEIADTPAALRRMKASSARILPPPLAASLIDQIDKDDWLRGKIGEIEGWDADSSNIPLAVSSLFVKRPRGWSGRLEKLVALHLDVVEVNDREQLSRQVIKLRRELEAARRKAKAAARASDAEIKALKEHVKDLRAESSAIEPLVQESVVVFRQQIQTLKHELAEAHEEAKLSQARNRKMKSDLLRSRRSKPAAQFGKSGLFGGRTPAAMARSIDDLVAAVRPDAPAPDLAAGERDLLALPSGVSPDTPAAIDWLVGRATPTVLLVDGYNVTWQIDRADFSTNRARQDLVTRLGQLKHRAKGPLRVVTVFDSQFGATVPVLGASVEVVFAENADEEVRRIASETSGDVVVISSDREVRDGSSVAGALVMWSEAFSKWK